MNTAPAHDRQECLHCAYERHCDAQEAAFAQAREQAAKATEAFLKEHPNAGSVRRFIFEVLGV